MKRRQFLLSSGAAAAAATIAKPGLAQQAWPLAKPITIVVAVAPGGSADLVARAVADVAKKELPGATVVVKNVVGGGGVTGFAEVAASPADGYTLGLVNVGSLLILPHTQQMPFSMNSFTFLGTVGGAYNGIGSAATGPYKSIADVVAAGKQKTLTFTTATPLQALAVFQLGTLTGAKFRLVLTQTQAEAVSEVVGGHVDFCIQNPPEMTPLIEGKQMNFLASAATERWPNYPNVPTLIEMGYKAVDIVPLGFACPAGVPASISSRLEAVIVKAAGDADVLDTLKKFSTAPLKMTGAEFLNALKQMAPEVEKVLVEAGIKKT